MGDNYVCIEIIDKIGLRMLLEQQVLDEVGLAVVQMPGSRNLNEPQLHRRRNGIAVCCQIS